MALQIYRLEDPDDLGSMRFIGTNRAAAAMVGVEYEELLQDVGRTFREFVPDILDTDIPATYKRVIDSGKPTT